MGNNCCVSIYARRLYLQQALTGLQQADFDLRYVSVVGKGCHAQALPMGFCHSGEQVRYFGNGSDFWENVWALLTDAACLWIPGNGSLAAAGHIVPLMVRGLQGVEINTGFSVAGEALYGTGVPRRSIHEYERAINAENYLLLVSGQRCEVERACDILHCETQQVTVHRG